MPLLFKFVGSSPNHLLNLGGSHSPFQHLLLQASIGRGLNNARNRAPDAEDPRAAPTAPLRPMLTALSAKFDDLDNLIRHFGNTPAGAAMIAAYHKSRNIIDRGSSPAPSGGSPVPGPSGASSSSGGEPSQSSSSAG